MINLIISSSYRKFVEASIVEQSVITALEYLEITDEIEINIAIKSDRALRKLNKQYREIDSSTDVLSFPADEIDPETNLRLLGDVIIAFPVVRQQAEDANVPVEQELQLLVVHGLLHLLGYDHEIDSDKDKMWTIQRAILRLLSINPDRAG
jgi:probable rRNA maturation factor